MLDFVNTLIEPKGEGDWRILLNFVNFFRDLQYFSFFKMSNQSA